MRKIDRKLNLQKVNILTEQRYLESKGILKEEMELKRGDEIVWVAPPKEIGRLVRIMTGAKGEYIGRETSGEYVVEFGGRRFHANDFNFELANQGGLREELGSGNFNSVRIVNKNDFDKFIKSNPALGAIYDEDTNKFKVYLYADLVGYFDPKYGRLDFEKDSRFAKVSDEYTWDRNF
jgi:hypothetical protein